MAETTKIEWTEATWNPITGCTIMSPGCTHCYAMKLAGTRLKHHPSRKGLTKPTKAGPVWTGEVRLNEQWLDQPLHWKRPRKIFVCAHSDLFYSAVPEAWILAVFTTMANARQHTFQVLTKRPDRAREILNRWQRDGLTLREGHGAMLPNVWIGTSVERQKEADERIPELLGIPATVRYLSLEPLLGKVDLWGARYRHPTGGYICNAFDCGNGVNWAIVGGESAGPRARPWDDDWARAIRDECKAAGVPFFMKQVRNKGPIPADLLVREMPGINLRRAA